MRVVPSGERIPVGLSKHTGGAMSGYQFRLPVLAWHMTGYDCACDVKRPGWWALNILIKTEWHGFRFMWGWALVRQTGPEQSLSGLSA